MIKTKELVKQELKDLQEEFECLESPMQKMEYILDFAKEGSVNEDVCEEHENKVEGCVTRAYLKIISYDNSQIQVQYFADALIIRGFFEIIKQILENSRYEELKENLELIKLFSLHVGLESFLSPNRANALFNIFKKIEYLALN
ncbi:MAG: SufE family protein [Candidatus Woesearchaeota archaeon]